eukprot:TRINITY_DN11555_c0_g1_i1.p1 TRINITY_DN11555_c0_g1~~TRINITY_DN11555_c0_g1_i1.p1  ORF type:complete len:667 (-),score=201.16 TRINITY_DN11555_c0_g1_i1:38-2038(-)
MSEELCLATIRAFSADVVQKAKSGHPGAPMGMAAMAYSVWAKNLKFNPKDPDWIARDRFVLSNGHASALLYTLLHLSGNPFWSLDVLQSFRQLNSPAAGHPESHFPGIEVTTGPLGQGISNAVGLAIAEKHLAATYNKEGFEIIDNYTYVFCGDGCLQEGVSSEASSIAGHLGLGKLIVLYDDNNITIDGSTSLSWSEDVTARYESYGWHTIHIEDGNNDVQSILAAIEEAKSVTDKPSFIRVSTVIGYGSSKEGTHGVHGSPLGDDDIIQLKEKFGLPADKFYIPEEVRAVFDKTEEGENLQSEWEELFEKYAAQYPDLAEELTRRTNSEIPVDDIRAALPTFTPEDAPLPTRKVSALVINSISDILPEFIGGSADLNPSCFTYINNSPDFQKETPEGKNLRFGVREHGMTAVCNGLYAYGAIIPFCSTFLNFLGYAYGAVLLSAISHFKVLFCFTHDSVALGEDGPTHQPISISSVVRSTPDIYFFRPADATETTAAYFAALSVVGEHPSVFSLSRQNLPHLAESDFDKTLQGAYTLKNADSPSVIFVATGSEVSLALEAAKEIENSVVVSMPCQELFNEQPIEYKQSVLKEGVPILSVEAATTFGWEKYAHASVGINSFGTSAPGGQAMEYFGMSVENVVAKANALISFYESKPVPNLLEKPF